MSPNLRRKATLCFAVVVAACLQANFASRWQVAGVQANFLTATAIGISIFCDMTGAAATGFSCGLILAAISSPPAGGVGAIIVSTTVAAAGVGWMERRVFRDNALLAAPLTLLACLAASLLAFVISPQAGVTQYVGHAAGAAALNAVLAIPLYLGLRAGIGRQPRRELQMAE
ncbi:MAG: hypothetical protein KGJ62_13470 [Armatimonadetes bacterium]|nr:hypothetical protein [Armatimonadota bacterium]